MTEALHARLPVRVAVLADLADRAPAHVGEVDLVVVRFDANVSVL